MNNLQFEDIGTGGGCVGYYTKFKSYTFYLTTMHELTLPKDGETVSLGIYDTEFEEQFASDTIKDFDSTKMEEYVMNSLDKYLKLKKIRSHKHSNDIFFLE